MGNYDQSIGNNNLNITRSAKSLQLFTGSRLSTISLAAGSKLSLSDHQVNISVGRFETLSTKSLVIHETRPQDGGRYTCTVDDGRGHSEQEHVFLHVISEQECWKFTNYFLGILTSVGI